MLIIGIDPGITGSICFFKEGKIIQSLYKTAVKYGIKYIISGGNYSGEGILPLTWGYHVLKDVKLYRHIVKNYSKTKIKKVPIVGLKGEIYYKFLKRIKTIYPLNFVEYNKDEAKHFLINEFKWKDYGGKHAESKITAFSHSFKSLILLEEEGCVLINCGGSLPLLASFILSHNFFVSLMS